MAKGIITLLLILAGCVLSNYVENLGNKPDTEIYPQYLTEVELYRDKGYTCTRNGSQYSCGKEDNSYTDTEDRRQILLAKRRLIGGYNDGY